MGSNGVSSHVRLRLLTPRKTIAYVVAFFTLPYLCLLLVAYQRFCLCRAKMKLKTTASRIADILFVVLLLIPPWVAGSLIWINVQSIRAAHNPRPKKKEYLWEAGFKIDLFVSTSWACILWSCKGIFMCIYVDIRTVTARHIRTIINATCILLVITFFVSIGVNLLWCIPMNRNWNLGLDHCSLQTDKVPLTLVAALHLTTDAIVLCIPILMLYHVSVNRKDRSAFAFIFLLGVLTVGAGVVSYAFRIEAQVNVSRVKLKDARSSFLEEERRIMEKVQLASYAEIAVAIFTASLPELRLAFRRRKKRESVAASDQGVEVRRWSVRWGDGKWKTYTEMLLLEVEGGRVEGSGTPGDMPERTGREV